MAKRKGKLPIGKKEDVEYSAELADGEDLQARHRAKAADKRQEKKR